MKEKSKCKIVIFSDIHYAPEKPIKSWSNTERKLTQYAIPLLEKLIDKIDNEIKPDIAINLGDLVEDFNNHDKDIINLNFIWKFLKNIKIPFYSVTGNHDLRSMNSRIEVEKIMGYKHSTFSIDMRGYHFIFLGLDVNTNLGKDKQYREGRNIKDTVYIRGRFNLAKKRFREQQFTLLNIYSLWNSRR